MPAIPRPTAILGATLALALGAAAPPARAQSAEPALAIARDDAKLAWGPCPDFMPTGCQLALLHGDSAKPGADVFFKVPAGYRIPTHWHTSAERMVLVAGQLEVTYAGQAATTLTPGQYAYGPAKAPHGAVCGKDSECVLFIAFDGPVDAYPADKAPESKAKGDA